MSQSLSQDRSTPDRRKIWEAIDSAAAHVPNWVTRLERDLVKPCDRAQNDTSASGARAEPQKASR